MNEIRDFFKRYYTYYLALEADFLSTERFVSIDPDNNKTFSVEYIKQLQSICSEVEVVSKYICSIINPNEKCENFADCCKIIIDSNPLFHRASTKVPQMEELLIVPFLNWSYTIVTDKKGEKHINPNNPEWWIKHNKIKHNRQGIDPDTKIAYYKYANQRNVLYALAALYILNSYIIFELCGNISDKKIRDYYLEEWKNGSRLFNSYMCAPASRRQ